MGYRESRSPNQICQWNPQLDFQGNWASVSASVSASVECEHDHIVIVKSILDLHEHGGDTDGSTIVSNTATLNLSFGCGPELELRLQTTASDLCAGGRSLSVPCQTTLSILLQPHLQESMKVYLRERKYA